MGASVIAPAGPSAPSAQPPSRDDLPAPQPGPEASVAPNAATGLSGSPEGLPAGLPPALSAWLSAGPAAWLLALTASISLAWSHAKLLSQDEIFVLQTDQVHSLRALVHVQHSLPISLDPLFYHVLAHLSLTALHAQTPGAQAFALRLPSLLGFLLMQTCLFQFVRRSALHRPGISPAARRASATLALGLPAITATLFYAAEARPYGLLLGLSGVILVSWQTAAQTRPGEPSPRFGSHGAALEPPLGAPLESPLGIRREATPARRTGALVALAAALALALNTHYFAVLLLLPLAAAECAYGVLRRRLDLRMIAALAGGAAGFVFTLPFQKAASEFRRHYYNAHAVTPHAITQAYRSLLLDYTQTSMGTQRVLALSLLVGAALFTWRVLRLLGSRPEPPARVEAVLLTALAALPVAGFALGRLATHSFEVRYVLPALPALAVLLALVLAPSLSQPRPRRGVLLSVGCAIALAGAVRIQGERQRTRDYLSSLALSPAVASALTFVPDHRLYVQDLGQFEPASFYFLGKLAAGLHPSLTLLYGRDEELRWDHHDTASLTAMHLHRFTDLPICSWAELTATPGPKVLVLFHSGWDWTDQALQTSGAQIEPLGPALGGEAVLVRWPGHGDAASPSIKP